MLQNHRSLYQPELHSLPATLDKLQEPSDILEQYTECLQRNDLILSYSQEVRTSVVVQFLTNISRTTHQI
jgi:hypothetical protein